MEYLRVMKIPFPRIVPPAMSLRSLPGIRFALVLGLLAAVPGPGGFVSPAELFGSTMRCAAYVVRVRVARPSVVTKAVFDSVTGRKSWHDVRRYRVLEILAVPSGGKVPRNLLVVDAGLQRFEGATILSAGGLMVPPSSVLGHGENCREGEDRILLLAERDRRGEYPEINTGACLPARHRGRIDSFLTVAAKAKGRRERECGTGGVCTDEPCFRSPGKLSPRKLGADPEEVSATGEERVRGIAKSACGASI